MGYGRIPQLCLLVSLFFTGTLCNYTCLFGNDLPFPQEGQQVAKCGPHETCYLEQYVTPSGYVRHKAGCKDVLFCNSTSISSPNIGVCSDCCSTDICATKLCGNTGWPTNLGPICYHCDFDVQGPRACDTIKVCGTDDVCGISLKPGGIYEIKCMRQKACNQLLYSSQCASCCTSQLCNTNCVKNNLTTPATTSTTTSSTTTTTSSTTTTVSACADDPTCQSLKQTFQMNGQDICQMPTFATFCLKTCGLCPGMTTTTSQPLTTQKNVCSVHPCNNGTCHVLPTGTFQCSCDQGFTGFLCDKIDPCTSPLCLNGGTCTPTSTGSFHCTCPVGHTGTFCEKSDPCSLGLCENGGSCISASSGGFHCSCAQGYTGVFCQTATPVNPCFPNPCLNGTCINHQTYYSCDCYQGFTGRRCQEELRDCKDIQDQGIQRTPDDIYVARVGGTVENVKCDFTTAGGGWTVIMNRENNRTNFEDQDYSAYAAGFGDFHENFWAGLETMHGLTQDGRRYQLRVEITVANGTKYFETYDDFTVGPPKEFVLHVGNHNGNAGDSLSGHSGFGFTNKDFDRDSNAGTNCGVYLHGAWWFHTCYDSCLTCPYLAPGTLECRSFSWNSAGHCTALKSARMLVKPM